MKAEARGRMQSVPCLLRMVTVSIRLSVVYPLPYVNNHPALTMGPDVSAKPLNPVLLSYNAGEGKGRGCWVLV